MGASQEPAVICSLTKAQAALLEDESSTVLGFVGGIGSGKTRGLAIKTNRLAEANAPVPVAFVEPTFRMVKAVAEESFRELWLEWGIWNRVKYNRNDHTFEFPINGKTARIWLVNGSDHESMAGPNLGAAVIDEAGLSKIRPEFAQQMQQRVRHPKALLKQFVAGGTPDMGKRGWFYEMMEGDPAPGTRLIRARTADNYFLDEDYVATRFAGMDPVNRRRYLEGEFLDLYGRVYTQYEPERHHLERPTDDDYRRRHLEHTMFCDFGTGVQAWGFGHVEEIDGERACHATGEQVLEGGVDTQDAGDRAAAFLAGRYSEIYGRPLNPKQAASMTTVYCDPAGGELFKGSMADVRILERIGFKVEHLFRHTSVKQRVSCVQQALFLNRFFVDPELCPYLDRCLRLQGYDEYGRPEKGRTRDGAKGLDHMIDAAGYWIQIIAPVDDGGAYEFDAH